LKELYGHDKPDLIVHDDCLDVAGRTLARLWGIPMVRHVCQVPLLSTIGRFAEDKCLIVSVPKFFVKDVEAFDQRFSFIGFSAEGRRSFFEPWKGGDAGRKTILACPTTGLLPSTEFCSQVVDAFAKQPWRVVLSVSLACDPVCEIELSSLHNLPENLELNQHSSNLDILPYASLFVGQGGQGSTLEALYSGVPLILIPPTPFHAESRNWV
jgi:UDP:flavonoid glycosyltransferase YjiC (YdhE family)